MMGLFHVYCFKSFGIVKTRILSDFYNGLNYIFLSMKCHSNCVSLA